jgi:hypothetical protein
MEDTILHSGHLWKRSPTVFKDFKYRFFRIENSGSLLSYYKSEIDLYHPLK